MGNPFERHRFLDAGDYFGTWQRLDIPLHISAEYCLFLESDAFVFKQPKFKDFGPDITATLAFSSGTEEDVKASRDSGVMLMNVPFMRETSAQFRSFVFNRSSPSFVAAPAHHGAYLDFYGSRVTFL